MPDGHVFISYSRNDGNAYASKLEAALKARNFAVWRDVRNIRPELDFTADIETGIENASHVVVCITPDTKRDNSFVRREIQYALLVHEERRKNGKSLPVIPLRFEEIKPHISIVNNEWVEFFKDWDAAFARICTILGGEAYENRSSSEVDDPFKPYLQHLLGRVTDYLKRAVIRKLDQSVEDTPDAVLERPREKDIFDQLFAGLPIDHPQQEVPFINFIEGFNRYEGRVLLLGEPGAGKTITLMAHTRDAVAARLDDRNAPLPLFGLIATWDSQEQPSLARWITKTYPSLLTEADIEKVITRGNALLVLDGLDELGSEREDDTSKKRYDPRIRFISQIPKNNQLLITCRINDYEELSVKIPLSGAITLKPLSDEQIQIYLQDYPELRQLLQNDPVLREITRTPLLLSLFTFVVNDMSQIDRTQLIKLKDIGDIRDKIFKFYVDKRYNHEAARRSVAFRLDELIETLGKLAMANAGVVVSTRNPIYQMDIARVLDRSRVPIFTELATRLNIFTSSSRHFDQNSSFYFVHLLLRDYFAFNYALPNLMNDDVVIRWRAADVLGKLRDVRAVDALIISLTDADTLVRLASIEALGKLGVPLAIEPIRAMLKDINAQNRVEAMRTLIQLAGSRAIPDLIECLSDEERFSDQFGDYWSVCDIAAFLLEEMNVPEAKVAVDTWRAE